LGNLILLVFEAVLEVVCVSLPGYIIARQGMFSPDMQKFVANLNVSLFTPCLIFTKLASQLTLSKIAELAVIPVIFVVMTLTSYLCSIMVCRIFRFRKRGRNFVIAMGVFGNSNSLPISLVISLSMTIRGLHWDRIPGDNDEDVAARGILYLLIFQQLGQLVRWSWGYHVLLAPPGKHDERDDETPAVPQIDPRRRYRDDPSMDEESFSDSDIGAQTGIDPFQSPQFESSYVGLHRHAPAEAVGTDGLLSVETRHGYSETNSEYPTRAQSPDSPFTQSSATSFSSRPSSNHGNPVEEDDLTSFPPPVVQHQPPSPSIVIKSRLPPLVGKVWIPVSKFFVGTYKTFMAIMNPPLWAMLFAIIVASIPKLQALFFTPGTFIQNSVTRAVSQSGNVAVPLILVVLGANLAGNTKATDSLLDKRAANFNNKLLVASILSRMVLPYLFAAPLLAVAAKYIPISLLDDPIFVVVCFLLLGAPSALQLAQICQINGVYEAVMSRILFWSYVVVILPSTLVLVITAIEV
ncbi:auxin efflux carrier, partial [Kalaharituber pfeilii]